MAKLELKNVFKRYDSGKKKLFRKKKKLDYAVSNLSFTCNDGEFIGILGPSGCGKTTTLRMIAGLEEITGGEVCIGDKVVNDLPPKDRHIGLAFEDYALYPPLSIYDNLAFNMRARNMSEEEVKNAVDYVAPLLKVDDLLELTPPALSGGQKQRVNIARAIIRKPSLLLLDEPLSHLDGKMRQELRHEIKRMHYELGSTTIIVTHDQMEAMSLADRIIIMKDGLLQQMGTSLEVYDNPVNEFVAGFIGEPPMNLMPATIIKKEDGFFFTFEGSDLEVRVPDKYFDVVSDSQKVKLGVRPVDINIKYTEVQNKSSVAVAVYENLGDERRVSVRIGDNLMNITTTENVYYKPGDLTDISLHHERTHLFDIGTGNRIWT